MYRILLDFDDVIRIIRDNPDIVTVYLQSYTQTKAAQYGIVQTGALVLTLQHGDQLIALRIVLGERESHGRQDGQEARDGLRAIERDAVPVVRLALEAAGATVQSGLLLEPGLFDDLMRFRADHQLFTIERGRVVETPAA